MNKKIETILWSIALPGFAQLLNKEFLKGFLFVILEFIINVNSHFNRAIMLSFLGDIDQAFEVLDFGWILFYPCLYFFAMWDAYRSVLQQLKEEIAYQFIPFVSCAYFVTVGIMFSPRVQLFHYHLGPIFTPMLFVIPGASIGLFAQFLLSRRK
ncbi:membrane protein [Bacillus coahuilensis m2-6]|uniref:hypothetical protein n=1 Tax=Bacillus coahuilensis TaxID=408580 RepID=UPI000750058F|nr:hypothetical protein [Bacillus coahuilensis]KUP08898.1 membrane protein [Bacillus coahuilensis m2-6]